VLDKALAKSPQSRHASAAAFAEALRPYGPRDFVVEIPAPRSDTSAMPPLANGPDSAPGVSSGSATVPQFGEPNIPDVPEEPIPPPPGTGVSTRTLIVVSALSVLFGILAAVTAIKLKLFG
jgi:hypothetical protein